VLGRKVFRLDAALALLAPWLSSFCFRVTSLSVTAAIFISFIIFLDAMVVARSWRELCDVLKHSGYVASILLIFVAAYLTELGYRRKRLIAMWLSSLNVELSQCLEGTGSVCLAQS
jgi:hypothetical protein